MADIRLSQVIGKGYEKFWNDKSRYRVLKGGKGSKKSTTTALNYIYRLMKYPKSNLLVIRAVSLTHRDSTFAQLKWAQEKLGVSGLWKNTVSPMEMVYEPTGQKIIFRGFDDVLKLASTTVSKGYLCWVWIEEAYEIGSESDFDKLDMSVPRGQISEGLFKQTTITFNPWSETHWLKSRFFDIKTPNVSTYSTNYLCNEFLTEADIEVFEQMKKRNYRKYSVAGLGNWGVSDGLVYENWEIKEFERENLGIVFSESGEVIKNDNWKYRCFFGLDYGYTNDPTAFICFAVNPIDKEIFIYDEYYKTRMLNCDIADMIKQKGYAKERIRADSAEPKSNDDLRRLGISRITASVKGKDSVLNGINTISEYKIYVRPVCKNTISELSSYCYKKGTAGRAINEPEDKNNHLMDALRYAFYDVRFFKPCNPALAKKRLTPDEYYNINHGISAADVKGGWL